MSLTIGTYSFLPWLRQGVGGTIAAADMDASVKTRATVRVDLRIDGTPLPGVGPVTDSVGRDLALYGPGDIVGIESRAIVRTEPHDWISNFEPNYLPYVDFYDEDFPWRYTPSAPDASGLRLRPWITLLVLRESEFTEGKNLAGKPLPYVQISDPSVFPPPDQLWAWSHVHVNSTLAANDGEFVSADMEAVLPRLQAVLRENPDLGYSRIVCPRLLAPETAYHAFIVPTFETGRLAGLGLDPAGAPFATFSAWGTYGTKPDPTSLPFYYRWFFRTATQGDFEYLVRLLQPKPVDSRVGTRPMDVLHPGSNLPPIDDARLHGILKLGGALRVPDKDLTEDELAERQLYDGWAQPYPQPFQSALARLVNLADDYAAQTPDAANAATDLAGVDDNPDPLITAPLYGRWHALTQRLLVDRDGNALTPNDNWVHELNLDPRYRVAAGFGTGVVQANQEDLMLAAWEQVGDVLEANRRIRAAQLAREAAFRMYVRHLQPLAAGAASERALVLTAPVQAHILGSPVTVRHLRTGSRLPPALTSAAMRRITRPRGAFMQGLSFDASRRPSNLLARANEGQVSAAPPKQPPSGTPTVEELASRLLPHGLPVFVVDALRRFPWLVYLPLALAVLVLVVAFVIGGAFLIVLGLVVAAALALATAALWRARASIARADVLREEDLTPAAIDRLPPTPDFHLAAPASGFTPHVDGTDSAEAVHFKSALREVAALAVGSTEAGSRPAPQQLALPTLTRTVVTAVDPVVTVPRRTLSGLDLPIRITGQLGETFQEVMAYPVIDEPMYKPLADISSELFLPNLNLIEQNSITLLETNRHFVEAYLVGLNHEFARELLWREYPTDQRGSYFRQFWDPRGFLDDQPGDPDELRERLRDITPLHHWSRASALGDHDNRSQHGAGEDVVLVIRGELLKKYPTAVIYAHHAAWQITDGHIDPAKERILEPLTAQEEEKPPRTKVKTPLFEAKIEPDIYFFGFDLTAADAEGGTGQNPNDPPGWFFVIKERPGEPRFGFDIEGDGRIVTFNDLAWSDALPGGVPGAFLQAGALSPLPLQPPGLGEDEKQAQHDEDVKVAPAPASAARWATLLFQAPVMVAVHASEMLRRR